MKNIQKTLQNALMLCQTGQLLEAKIIYLKLIKTIPNNFEVLTNLGTIELQLGNSEVGVKLLKKSISINPDQPHAITNLGNSLSESSLYNEAINYYNKAISINSNFIGAYFNKGKALTKLNDFENAINCYSKVIEISPDYLMAYINLGFVHNELMQYDKAIFQYNFAIKFEPNFSEAYFNRGIAYNNLKRYDDALSNYKRAIQLTPDYAEAFSNRGVTFNALKRYDDALSNYDRAIQLKPDFAQAFFNRGVTYNELKRHDDALSNYDRAIQLKPDYAEAFSNRGLTYNELKRHDDALLNYDHAIQLKPDFAQAFSNRGVTFNALKRYDDALSNYDRAIQLKPDFAQAFFNRGVTYNALKRHDDALSNYGRAIKLKPEVDYLLGDFIHTKMHLCDWENYYQLINQLADKTENNEKASAPFALSALTDNPKTQKQSAEIFINDRHPINNALPAIIRYPKHQKIRVGYFSADFHNHATMHLMGELFQYHDKSKFEVIAFSFGPDHQDEWRQLAIASFDQFIDVRSRTDLDVASLARELEIDIAVDLKGFTQDARVGIFAHRAAPIQVNYLGYPGTMGAAYIDYIIADPILIPDDKREHYSEKIAYLPNSYQVNVKDRLISDKAISRKEVGLPEDAFVFCSFNNNYKITPETFDRWMRILQAVEGSVLWILSSNGAAENNLKKMAELRGVDRSRLVFASFVPVEDHLKRIRLADLFLDTLPYNAHTTASDALRVGLPLVTMIGESFASRVAASLLNAVGLQELITTTPEAYESLAIELATNPKQLENVKNKLLTNLSESPLYNSRLFTQHIELAYQEMYRRYQEELAPDHIYIKS